MEPALIDFIATLDACGTFDEAWAATLKFFKSEGQPWICYGYFKPVQAGTAAMPDLKTNVPQNHVDNWISEKFYENDPVVRHVMTSGVPGTFGAEYVNRERDGEEVYRFYEGLRELGATSNVTVPLKDPSHRARGFVVMAGPRRKPEFERFLDDRASVLLAAANYADARMLELLGVEGLKDISLSPREAECLEWLSKGLMNDRIAERMRIAEPTVRLHLGNARRKLKALTREQALVKALKLGLLNI